MKKGITEDEFLGWKDHPVTREIMGLLTIWQEEVKDRLANGEFLLGSQPEALVYNAKLVGSYEVCDSIRNLNYAFIAQELGYEPDESVGPEALG